MIGEATAVLSASALRHNFRLLSSLAAPARPIAMLKANAYGHGATEVARILLEEGADFFAVARLSEALELRERYPSCRILVLGRTEPRHAALLCEKRLIQAVHSTDYAAALSAAACRSRVSVHIKVDSGMGRLGIPLSLPSHADSLLSVLCLPGLLPEALFSHLPSADRGDADEKSLAAVSAVRLLGRRLGLPVHILSSAGLLAFPVSDDAYVRPGLALYGYAPRATSLPLLPVMRLLAPVLQARRIRRGETVGYASTFRAPSDFPAAVLGIGYGDGLPRSAQGGFLKIKSYDAELIGRISMDLSVCRLPPDARVTEGCTALVFGDDPHSLPALAEAAGTISYELLASLTPRVKRVWTEEAIENII